MNSGQACSSRSFARAKPAVNAISTSEKHLGPTECLQASAIHWQITKSVGSPITGVGGRVRAPVAGDPDHLGGGHRCDTNSLRPYLGWGKWVGSLKIGGTAGEVVGPWEDSLLMG